MTSKHLLQTKWKIHKKLEQKFNEKTLKEFLRPFNQARGGHYFFFDLYRRKLILDMPKTCWKRIFASC